MRMEVALFCGKLACETFFFLSDFQKKYIQGNQALTVTPTDVNVETSLQIADSSGEYVTVECFCSDYIISNKYI